MILNCIGTGSLGNTYVLSDNKEYLILDAGMPVKSSVLPAIDFQISKVSGVLVTHHHRDHDGYSKEWESRGIKVIRPFDESHPITTIKKNSNYKIKHVELRDSMSHWVHSDSDGLECPIYGYYITHPELGVLVYATDCEIIKWKFPNVNHFLIEANYDLDTLENTNNRKYVDRVFKTHHSIQAACKFIQANQTDALKTVTLCHLSSHNGSPEQFRSKMQEVVGNNVVVNIAQKGTVFEL